MAEDSGQTVLPVLKSHILPLIPGLDKRLKEGSRVLDVGCGRGLALNLLATWFPNSRFVGIDLSEEAIKFARARRWRCSISRRQGSAPSKSMNWPMTSRTITTSAGLEGFRFSSQELVSNS